MSDQAIAQLLQIEQHVRRCETKTELAYVMVNMTRSLVNFEQAAFLTGTELAPLKTFAISDVALVDRTTPFCAWLEQVAKHESAQGSVQDIRALNAKAWPVELRADLAEFAASHMLWVPICIPAKENQRLGVMWLAKATPWSEREIGLMKHLSSSYGHALQLFSQRSNWGKWTDRLRSSKTVLAVCIGMIGLGFVPVNLTVLAPANIIAKDPVLVTAPLAGAVENVLVKPGDVITVGDVIVQMDTTEYQGQFDVAQRELERTQAALRTTEQAGYVERRKKSELLELESEVTLKKIERDFYKKRLQQTRILANVSGVAVFDGPDQWQGRPVVVGERVLSIADPEQIQLEVMLPVKDAISLDRGDKVTFYMDTDPLNPIAFNVLYSSYEPTQTPDQIIAYRVVAAPNKTVSSNESLLPRIGLRGTAKMYGDKVSLAYYLLRRPVTFVRQRLGI